MHKYTATVEWRLQGNFNAKQYSRAHTITFDSGTVLQASSSPFVVPLPYSDASAVDPEELFAASVASCHMLWFLALAAERGLAINTYSDTAQACMVRNETGTLWVSEVHLYPVIGWAEVPPPTEQEIQMLHREAHQKCFIAQSIRSLVVIH